MDSSYCVETNISIGRRKNGCYQLSMCFFFFLYKYKHTHITSDYLHKSLVFARSAIRLLPGFPRHKGLTSCCLFRSIVCVRDNNRRSSNVCLLTESPRQQQLRSKKRGLLCVYYCNSACFDRVCQCNVSRCYGDSTCHLYFYINLGKT